MTRTVLCAIALASACLAAHADLQLAPGTKIVFGDNSEMATAPTDSGGDIPAGHGGINNTVSGTNAYIGGGQSNTAGGNISTISGGSGNSAAGSFATIPGGANNVASGNYSFAVGRRAKSTQPGAMTIADSVNADFENNSANFFRLRATGGVLFATAVSIADGKSTPTEFFTINTSGNALLSGVLFADNVGVRPEGSSARNSRLVEGPVVLDRLVALPVQEYETESGREFGFSAQAFHDSFGLGNDPDTISLLDAQSVAFASIQTLYDTIQQRDERIEQLESALEEVLARLDALEAEAQ